MLGVLVLGVVKHDLDLVADLEFGAELGYVGADRADIWASNL
eukprot:SAG22_NODE_3692_length_1574_cov_13.357966_1_plen_42_part_00